MREYRAENAKPNPKSTINSYRSFGYNLSTALADIIDNSISAKATNINIDFIWHGKDSIITISDNGTGMSLPELIIAMTPGSKDPDDTRDEDDLGRFGMGLKTASFSQCKRVTVFTKKDGNSFNRCWDIDFINQEKEWTLLNYISDENLTYRIKSFNSGSVIIWEKLDRIVGNAEPENEAVKSAFYYEFVRVKEHIAMVFHRFIEKKKINIFFNGDEVNPWNPFLLNLDPKPETGPVETLNGKVEVSYYILPHMSRINQEDYQKSGGPLGWYQQQGFYVYRGDRLLVAGDWLDIDKKREYSKLARISINFPNAVDFDWNLDIKKSTAIPPVSLRKDLARIARLASLKSAKVYNWRGQKQLQTESADIPLQPLWNELLTREGVRKYSINRKHPVIKNLINLDEGSGKILNKVLKLIEENLPLEMIFYNHNDNPAQHEIEKISDIPSDALIELAIELYNMNVEQGVPAELAGQQIMNSIPFNQFPLIRSYLS